MGVAGVGKSAWEGWGPALRMRRKCPDTWTGWGERKGVREIEGREVEKFFLTVMGKKGKGRRGKDPVLKLRYSRG